MSEPFEPQPLADGRATTAVTRRDFARATGAVVLAFAAASSAQASIAEAKRHGAEQHKGEPFDDGTLFDDGTGWV